MVRRGKLYPRNELQLRAQVNLQLETGFHFYGGLGFRVEGFKFRVSGFRAKGYLRYCPTGTRQGIIISRTGRV